jgi:hypothetical protein
VVCLQDRILLYRSSNNSGHDVMTGSGTIYKEMVDIVSRHVTDDCEHKTLIDCLIVSRRTSSMQPLHTTQRPCFGLALQGEKSLTLGGEAYRYGFGDYLVVSLDLPVVS